MDERHLRNIIGGGIAGGIIYAALLALSSVWRWVRDWW